MSGSESAPALPDVTEMTAVHAVFRNAFAATPRLVGAVADGDTARAAIVGSFLANVLAFLHSHHQGEDELLFPKLVERAPGHPEVERIAGQHADVDTAVGVAEATLASWSATGSAETGRTLVADIASLDTVLEPHLTEEEREILPLVTDHITLEEWRELPPHAMRTFAGDDIFLIIGLLREQLDQAQRDTMLEVMPPPAAEAWRTVGIESYKKSVAALVG